MATTQKIIPFLWFENQAEAAARLYAETFDGRIVDTMGGGGQVVAVTLELFGQRIVALNGNTEHAFNPSSSLQIDCADQAEVDRYWAKLTEGGGREGRCGWLTDRFGVSWQIIPSALPRLLGHADRARAQRALQAMMTMGKIDVAALEKAAAGS